MMTVKELKKHIEKYDDNSYIYLALYDSVTKEDLKGGLLEVDIDEEESSTDFRLVLKTEVETHIEISFS